MDDLVNLDVGCGKNKLYAEMIGVDRYMPTDVIADMTAMPFATDSINGIYTSHALEHLPKKDVLLALAEFHRISNSVVDIRVPDLEYCVKEWLENGMDNGWHLDTIFGNQEHEGEFHKTGFTKDIMWNYLVEVGFNPETILFHVIQSHNQNTLVFYVQKG